MAEDPRTYQTSTVQANRAQMQGLGVGQKDMDMQREPNREEHATDPQNTEGWDNDPPNQATDRPSQADFADQDMGEERSFQSPDSGPARERNAAGAGDAGDLGVGTPPNVDVHKTGQGDKPQADWGEAAGQGATFSSNHNRRPDRTEAERGQGPKTRQMNKDIISGRT
jgi:hypothetical protein